MQVNEEGHNADGLPGYWSGVNKIQRLLRRVIGADPLIANDVAVSGSAALYWYQRRFDIGPKWKGRPHDIDVFVCGNNGRNFDRFMIHMWEEVLYNATSHGLRLQNQVIRFNTYAHPSATIKIHDFYIVDNRDTRSRPREFVLSFIESPFNTIQEAVDGFDINVCQVIYNIAQDDFIVSNELRECIRSGTAALTCGIEFFKESGRPSDDEIMKLHSTLDRIIKYNRRGYTFCNVSGIMFLPFEEMS
jgi:hypothetical protein